MYLAGPRVLAIGDSITYDITTTLNGAYRYYFGQPFSTWFRSPIVWVGKNAAVGVNAWSGTKMCGASGQRIDEINSTYDPGGQVLDLQPNLVIIHLGTNDMTQLNSGTWVGGSIDLSISNLSSLLTTIFANKSDVLVCVCKIIPNGTAGADTNITSWNSAMATMVAAHANAASIFTADLNTAFKNDASWLTDYMSDNTHPNDAGESLMASTILTAVQANVTRGTRAPALYRRSIKPHTASLSYAGSTATTMGSNVTLDTTQAWAVSMDVNLDRALLTSNNGLVSFKTDQTSRFMFIALGTSSRYIEFGNSTNFNRFFPAVTIEPFVVNKVHNGWHQILVTYNAGGRTLATSYRMYIDGEPIPLTNGSGFSSASNLNQIGAALGGGVAGRFDMADLTVWNGGSVMTAAQAREWYTKHILPSGPTLTRRWQHTDGSGTTLTDSTGNQNGTIGTATWSTSIPTKTRGAATARSVATTRSLAV